MKDDIKHIKNVADEVRKRRKIGLFGQIDGGKYHAGEVKPDTFYVYAFPAMNDFFNMRNLCYGEWSATIDGRSCFFAMRDMRYLARNIFYDTQVLEALFSGVEANDDSMNFVYDSREEIALLARQGIYEDTVKLFRDFEESWKEDMKATEGVGKVLSMLIRDTAFLSILFDKGFHNVEAAVHMEDEKWKDLLCRAQRNGLKSDRLFVMAELTSVLEDRSRVSKKWCDTFQLSDKEIKRKEDLKQEINSSAAQVCADMFTQEYIKAQMEKEFRVV